MLLQRLHQLFLVSPQVPVLSSTGTSIKIVTCGERTFSFFGAKLSAVSHPTTLFNTCVTKVNFPQFDSQIGFEIEGFRFLYAAGGCSVLSPVDKGYLVLGDSTPREMVDTTRMWCSL